MRVLHVIDSAGVYGAEKVMLALVEAHRASGLESAVLSVGEPGEADRPIEIEAQARGVPVRKVRMRAGFSWSGARALRREGERFGASVFHSHGYKGNVLLASTWFRRPRPAMVTTLHGWTSTRGWSKQRLYERADALSLYAFDRVVLVSPSQARDRWLPPGTRARRLIIPNGLPPVPAHALASAERDEFLALRGGRFTIGVIGRLAREKRIEDLVRAVGRLVAAGQPLLLAVIGDGPERSELARLVERLGLRHSVWMAGYRMEAARYLAHLDCLAISSSTEGLPLVLLEAMAAGVPVVATAVGGIPDVIRDGENGFLVPPEAPESLADALAVLARDPAEGRRVALAAREGIATSHSAAIMARRYRELYEELCAADLASEVAP